MQTYFESLIPFGLTRSKLLMFLSRSRSICGWTVLSLFHKVTNFVSQCKQVNPAWSTVTPVYQ